MAPGPKWAIRFFLSAAFHSGTLVADSARRELRPRAPLIDWTLVALHVALLRWDAPRTTDWIASISEAGPIRESSNS
jgi:hypothetical protein